MSNSPLLPLSEPKPRSINLVPTGMKPIFAGVAAVVLVAAAAGVAVPLYRSHTGDAALSRSTGSGDLSPALYETAPTDKNANGKHEGKVQGLRHAPVVDVSKSRIDGKPCR